MNSPTIVLAGRESQDWDFVLLAVRAAGIDPKLVVLHNGESVVSYFLHNHRKQRGGRAAHLSDRHECDLLLLDLALPVLDGLQILRQLRWLERDDLSTLPPIVMLSDACDGGLIAAAYRYGANGFLCTAASTPQLLDAVQQTVRYWLSATLRPVPVHSHRMIRTASRDASLLSQELVSP